MFDHTPSLSKSTWKAITLVVSIAFISLRPAPAAAAPITFDYQVRINGILKNDAGISLSLGDAISGHIVFDANFDTFIDWGGQTEFFYSSPDVWVSASLGGQQITNNLDYITIYDNHLLPTGRYFDRFFVNAGDINVGGTNGIQFWLDGPQSLEPPSLMTSTDLPTTPPDLADAEIKFLILRTPELDLYGDFVSLTGGTPVPLPASLIPLLSSIIALAGYGRFRRYRQRLRPCY